MLMQAWWGVGWLCWCRLGGGVGCADAGWVVGLVVLMLARWGGWLVVLM